MSKQIGVALSTPVLCLVLLVVLLLPTLLFFFGVGSSMALGTCVAATLIVSVVIGANRQRTGDYLEAQSSPSALIALILVVIGIHASFSMLTLPFNFGHAAASVMPLVLTLLAGRTLAGTLLASSSTAVHRAIWFCFFVLCMIAVLAAVGVTVSMSGNYVKPVFPFTEPSHFAQVFSPLMLYCCVTTSGKRRLLTFFAGVAAALLLQNLTLLFACVLTGLICFRTYFAAILLIIAAALTTRIDLSYYSDRLNLASDAHNLSSLVYLQGWQLLKESLQNSNGWGLGFQQLGQNGTAVSMSDEIFALSGGYMNLYDGSFMLSKVVSEFGIVGIMVLLIFAVLAKRAMVALRRQARRPQPMHAVLIFARSAIAAYVLELLVRGSGYFTGTAILLVASLWLVSIQTSQSHASMANREGPLVPASPHA